MDNYNNHMITKQEEREYKLKELKKYAEFVKDYCNITDECLYCPLLDSLCLDMARRMKSNRSIFL